MENEETVDATGAPALVGCGRFRLELSRFWRRIFLVPDVRIFGSKKWFGMSMHDVRILRCSDFWILEFWFMNFGCPNFWIFGSNFWFGTSMFEVQNFGF